MREGAVERASCWARGGEQQALAVRGGVIQAPRESGRKTKGVPLFFRSLLELRFEVDFVCECPRQGGF